MSYQDQLSEDAADKARSIRTKSAEIASTLNNDSEYHLVARATLIEDYLLGNIVSTNQLPDGGFAIQYTAEGSKYPK